jgi:hypothetical protein
MIVVGLRYAEQRQMGLDEIKGSSRNGASTITGGQGERLPSEQELAMARLQGLAPRSFFQLSVASVSFCSWALMPSPRRLALLSCSSRGRELAWMRPRAAAWSIRLMALSGMNRPLVRSASLAAAKITLPVIFTLGAPKRSRSPRSISMVSSTFGSGTIGVSSSIDRSRRLRNTRLLRSRCRMRGSRFRPSEARRPARSASIESIC